MGQMAFKNSLYDEDTMERMAKVPPTRLTQVWITTQLVFTCHPIVHVFRVIIHVL